MQRTALRAWRTPSRNSGAKTAVPVPVEVVPRRGLKREEAAHDVGISTTKFDELVKDGRTPQPFRIDGRVI